MATIRSQYQNKSWSKDNYIISTDPSWISVTRLNEFFATSDMHWTNTLPDDVVAETVSNSLCFGVYEYRSSTHKPEEHELVGFARCVTDFTTLLYLTDVYTIPRVRGTGLGRWLMACLKEVMDSMPHLRRIMFITSDWERSVPFYEQVLGASVIESRHPGPGDTGDHVAVLSKTGPGWPEH